MVQQQFDYRSLRKCPRCECGLPPTSPICEFCGGVLSPIAAAVVGIFILLACRQHLRPDAWEWKVWLGLTLWYVIMWALTKSK